MAVGCVKQNLDRPHTPTARVACLGQQFACRCNVVAIRSGGRVPRQAWRDNTVGRLLASAKDEITYAFPVNSEAQCLANLRVIQRFSGHIDPIEVTRERRHGVVVLAVFEFRNHLTGRRRHPVHIAIKIHIQTGGARLDGQGIYRFELHNIRIPILFVFF